MVESPEEAEGDEVVRRGRGLGGDILKEMKVRQELKRASVIPKTESVDAVDGRADDKPFANMHIRTPVMSTSVTAPSPTHQPPDLHKSFSHEAKSGETETIKHSSSSIIGLRSSTFESTAAAKKTEVPAVEEAGTGLKPRPQPKPRPWSIVGVDRKSGEYTAVEAAADAAEEDESRGGGSLLSQSVGRGSVRDMIASLNKPDSPGSVAATSVRDRIANMNKTVDPDTKRKGNSLPRSAEPGGGASPGTRQKNSPSNRKKESTSDDPRILQLEDDIFYDDTVNV